MAYQNQKNEPYTDFDNEDSNPESPHPSSMPVQLQHFEGPLDLLLSLAREQKLDLLEISIVELAEQYLAFIKNLQGLSLTIAADYLVMAAWLAFLKSRLLIPKEQRQELEEPPELEAERLAWRLQQLDILRKCASELWNKNQLGKDFLPFGMPTDINTTKNTQYNDTLYELLTAYGEFGKRTEQEELHILPTNLYSAEDLIKKFSAKLTKCTQWTPINEFLPKERKTPLQNRSAMAATLAATLEVVKQGQADIQQNQTFSPIYIKANPPESPHE